MNKIILLTTLLIGVLLINAPLHSQELTIGSNSDVSNGASLQIKQKKDITSTTLYDNATGALTLPRVELQSSTSLQPFITDADLPNQTKIHTGLMVYNIKTTDNGLIPGIYVWSNKKWNYVTDNAGTSVITTDKTEIIFTNDALEQTLDLEWVPIFASCKIEPAADGEGVKGLKAQLNNSGSYSSLSSYIMTPLGGKAKYKLKVDPFTTTELNRNPVRENRTNLALSFTDPKGNIITQNVLLRQINYGVKSYNASVYPVSNGTKFKFDVESNAAWTVSVVSGNANFVTGLENEKTNNSTGGSNGVLQTDVLSFIMQGTSFGNQVVLKFTPQTPGLFNDVIVTLTAANGILQPESNTYMISPSSSTILIPVSRANAQYTFKGVTNADRINSTDEFKAELQWTDVEFGIADNSAIRSITAVGKGKDAHLSVTPGTSVGNAVIAIRNTTTHEILWSWHIWVTDYAVDLTNPIYNTPGRQTATNGDVYTYYSGAKTTVFMDRNLGAKQGGNVTRPAINGNSLTGDLVGLLYQFGRKDPFPNIPAASSTFATWFDRIGNVLTVGNPLNGSTGTGMNFISSQVPVGDNNLEYSIKNPLDFIYGGASSGGDWFVHDYLDCPTDLWDKSTYNPTIEDNTKTVFDPCPVGWRVPRSGPTTKSPWHNPNGASGTLFPITNFNGTFYDDSPRGLEFNDPFYEIGFWPLPGRMEKSNGVIGQSFAYWAASVVQTNYARVYSYSMSPFNKTDGVIQTSGTAGNRAQGTAVRCVKE